MEKIILYIILSLIFLVSCSKDKVSPTEYVRYIENPANGLLIQQKTNGVGYMLQYQPTEYVTMLELHTFDFSSDTFRMVYKRFKGLEHYMFKIDRNGLDSIASKSRDSAKSKKMEYLDFKIQKDLKMVEGSDTLPCAICQCESSFGMTPYYTFVLGFTKKEYDGNREFLLDDNTLGEGKIKMMVKAKNIDNIPGLKFL